MSLGRDDPAGDPGERASCQGDILVGSLAGRCDRQLQQSLVANFDLSKRLNSEVAEKEKARREIAEAERLLG